MGPQVTVVMLGGYMVSVVRGPDEMPAAALSFRLANGQNVELLLPDGKVTEFFGIPNEMLPELIRALKQAKASLAPVGQN